MERINNFGERTTGVIKLEDLMLLIKILILSQLRNQNRKYC